MANGIKLRDDGKKRWIYSDIRKEPKQETQRESQASGKTGLNRKTPEQLAAEKRAETLKLQGIGEPVVKGKDESTSQALERSGSKTARTFAQANPNKNVEVRIGFQSYQTPTSSSSADLKQTQTLSKQERLQNFYKESQTAVDQGGFVFGKSFNIKNPDSSTNTLKLQRTPQDFSDKTITPNWTDTGVYIFGKYVVRDPDFISGKTTKQDIANFNSQLLGEGIGAGRSIQKTLDKAKLTTTNPLTRAGIDVVGGATKFVVRDPIYVPSVYLLSRGGGFALGLGSKAVAPITQTIKGVPGGTAALKGIGIGSKVGFTGLVVGSTAVQVSSSNKPLETIGRIGVEYGAIGSGLTTGIKRGNSAANTIKNKYSEVRASILNERYAGQLTTNVKPKDLTRFQGQDIQVQGKELKGITFSGSQTTSGTTTLRKNIFSSERNIKPDEIQQADFYRLNFQGTKTTPSYQNKLTPGNAVEPKYNFIIGQKTTRTPDSVTIKGDFLVNKKQGDFILQTEGFGKINKNLYSEQPSYLRGEAELKGFKFSNEGGLVRTKPTNTQKVFRLERSKPLTQEQTDKSLFGFTEKGVAERPPFGEPVFYQPSKAAVKPIRIFKIGQIISKPTQTTVQAGEVFSKAASGTATVQILKTENVKQETLKKDLTQAFKEQKTTSVQKVEPVRQEFKTEQKLFTINKPSQVKATILKPTQTRASTFKAFTTPRSSVAQRTSSGFRVSQNFGQAPRLDNKQSLSNLFKTNTVQSNIPVTSLKSATLTNNVFSNPLKQFNTVRSVKEASRTSLPKFDVPSLKNDFGSGFDVEVRRRGKFQRVNQEQLGLSKALKLGAGVVSGTAAASFRVLPRSGTAGSLDTGTALGNLGSKFRLSKKDKNVFVQKSQFRISSFGEKREITLKGINTPKKKGKGRSKGLFDL